MIRTERSLRYRQSVAPRLLTTLTLLTAIGVAVEAMAVKRADDRSSPQGITEQIPDFLKSVKRTVRRTASSSVDTYFLGSPVNLRNQFGELARYRTATGARETAATVKESSRTVPAEFSFLGGPFLGLINPGDKKRKFGLKQATLLVALAGIMWSCASPAIRPTAVATEQAPIVATATRVRPTIIPESTATAVVTPTEAAPKQGDTKTVTENGYEYRYTYNAEYGQWLREVADFPLLDYPVDKLVPFTVRISDSVSGERNLLTMTHENDFLGKGKNSRGSYDPMPIKAALVPQILKRYFSSGDRQLNSNQQQDALHNEMLGKGEGEHTQAYLPITLSNGEEAQVKLSANSGVILTITDVPKLQEMGGDYVSTGYINGMVYYAEVYGVDSQGNELVRLAFDVPLNQIDDATFRQALFMFPARLVEKKDQGDIGPSGFSIALATDVSTRIQPGGTTKDLEIQYIQPQP